LISRNGAKRTGLLKGFGQTDGGEEMALNARVVLPGLVLCLAAGISGSVLADPVADCRQSRSAPVRIRACTEVIEGASFASDVKATAYRNRGNVRAAAGAHGEAIRDLDEAIRLRPDDASAYAGRGQVRLARGDRKEAIADLDKAIELDARSARYHILRGHAHLVADNADGAIADFDAAIGLEPENPSAFNNRGLAYRKKGDIDRAIADYSSAVMLNPIYALAYNNRGYAYEARGETEKAISDYRRALLVDASLSGAKDGLNRLGAAGGVAAESEEMAREGRALVDKNCGWCHATGVSGPSPNPKAPEFRNLQERHPLLALREPLSRGIAAPHDVMPRFGLTDAEIDRIVAYINTLKPED
jgi:tetratricopeptide (TPR) repeat protein